MPFTFQIQTTENNQTFGFIADAGTLYIDWGDSQTHRINSNNGALRKFSLYCGTYNISLTEQQQLLFVERNNANFR